MLRFEIVAVIAICFLSSLSIVFSASDRRVATIASPENDQFKPDQVQPWQKSKPLGRVRKDTNATSLDSDRPWLKPRVVSRAVQSVQNKWSRRAEYLSAHNKIRAKFNEKPLKWDPKLVTFAKQLAKSRKEKCTMVHTPNSPYGENLLWTLKGPWKPSSVVEKWTDEVKYFDRKMNVCIGGKDCGHYTQIVWAETQRVGCGRAQCKNHKGFIYACAYDPPGNYYHEGPFGGTFPGSIVPPT